MLLLKSPFKVSDRGELVVLQVSGWSASLEFQVALELSALLRSEAKCAKFNARDGSFRHTVVGVLSNVTPERAFVSRWRKALPERLARKRIQVAADGTLVKLTVGRMTMDFPYPDAQRIAQALRVHGKLARNAAGEMAHWSRLAGVA